MAEEGGSGMVTPDTGNLFPRRLLDMGEVPMVDSAGLGELISVYTSAHRSNAALKLMKISERVREVLSITRMNGLFDVFDDKAAAIASFC